MAKKPQKLEEIKDESGADDRFLRGIKAALKAPPKPFTPPTRGKAKAGGKSKGKNDEGK